MSSPELAWIVQTGSVPQDCPPPSPNLDATCKSQVVNYISDQLAINWRFSHPTHKAQRNTSIMFMLYYKEYYRGYKMYSHTKRYIGWESREVWSTGACSYGVGVFHPPNTWLCSPTWKLFKTYCLRHTQRLPHLSMTHHWLILPGGRGNGTETLVFLLTHLHSEGIQDPIESHLRTKDVFFTQEVLRDSGALCEELGQETKYTFLTVSFSSTLCSVRTTVDVCEQALYVGHRAMCFDMTISLNPHNNLLRVRVHAQLYRTLCDPMDCSLPASSVGFFRQEYWSGLLIPPAEDLPDQGSSLRLFGLLPVSLVSPA